MMGNVNDGGPVYPGQSYPATPEQVRALRDEAGVGLMEARGWATHHTGISLRDWFAGQALAGTARARLEPEEAAARAYRWADAMIAAREQKEEDL